MLFSKEITNKTSCSFWLFFFFIDHLLWPHWTGRTQHGSRKQWKLLSFERQAPLWSLKSVEKYRLLLCLLQTRPALTRWALQSCCNQTNQDNTYWLNHWPRRCAEMHAWHVCVCACTRVCPKHRNDQGRQAINSPLLTCCHLCDWSTGECFAFKSR